MSRWSVLLAAGALAACAAQSRDAPDAGSSRNLAEAARINAQLGINYLQKGELKLAEEKLKRSVSEDPGLAMAQTGLGILYARRGMDDEAERAFRESLKLEPDNPDGLNNYGSFLCAKGKVDKAEELFLKAAHNRDYTHPEMAWTNAAVCLRTRSPDKAELYLREALKQDPAFPTALSQFAWLSYQKADYLRARAFLQRYEAVAAPAADTLWLRAKTEAALGDVTTSRLYEQRLKIQFPEASFADTPAKPP